MTATRSARQTCFRKMQPKKFVARGIPSPPRAAATPGHAEEGFPILPLNEPAFSICFFLRRESKIAHGCAPASGCAVGSCTGTRGGAVGGASAFNAPPGSVSSGWRAAAGVCARSRAPAQDWRRRESGGTPAHVRRTRSGGGAARRLDGTSESTAREPDNVAGCKRGRQRSSGHRHGYSASSVPELAGHPSGAGDALIPWSGRVWRRSYQRNGRSSVSGTSFGVPDCRISCRNPRECTSGSDARGVRAGAGASFLTRAV